MKHHLVLLSLLLFFISCKNNTSSDGVFPETKTIKHSKIFSDNEPIFRGGDMLHFERDNSLIIEIYKDDYNLLKVNLNDNSITKLLPVGNGPGEFVRIDISQKTSDSTFLFQDTNSAQLYEMNIITGEVKKDESGLPYRGIVTSVASSTGFGIWSRSKNKEAAYKLVEFFCTGKLQSEQAKTGVLLPAYKAVVEKDYIEANEKNPEGPKNIRAIAEYLDNYQVCSEEYLPDTAWIFDWADDLNYKYREDRRSVDDFLAFAYEKGNAKLKLYTEQGYNFGE